MGSATDLSDIEDDKPPLTAAQKARLTREHNKAEELRRNEALAVETEIAGGRSAKKRALVLKIWDLDGKRKRPEQLDAVSDSEQAPQKPKKKSKSAAAASKDDSNDEMSQDSGAAPASSVTPKNRKPLAKPRLSKGVEGVRATPAKSARKYIAAPIRLDDDSEPSDTAPAPTTKKTSKASSKSATSGNDESQSSAEESDRVSGDDDGLSGNVDEVKRRLLSERPRLVRKDPPKPVVDDDSMDDAPPPFDATKMPSLYREPRHSSTSSRGGSEYDIPHDTDFSDNHSRDRDDSDSGSRSAPRAKKKSAQQVKYDTEKPTVRRSKGTVTEEKISEATVIAEIEWHQTVRLRFPSHRGPIRLRDQTPIVQDVVKTAVDIGLYDIAFKHAYSPVPSRAVECQSLLRRSAKRLGERGVLVLARAKQDIEFCRLLAPLIFARFGKHRNSIRNSALQKVPAHYELLKLGITQKQVREKVEALGKDQKFIYAYNPRLSFPSGRAPAVVVEATAPPVVEGDVVPAAAPVAAVTFVTHNSQRVDTLKFFKLNGPFLAPAIADIIHEIWFANAKAFGYKQKNISAMVSHCAAFPNEPELPAPMVCMVAANVHAALLTYSNGSFLPAPEFSQSRLEDTYVVLMEMIAAQRVASDANVAAFHKVMHRLYLNASVTSGSSSAASGSAANVMQLDIED
ncbi:hypothetical protein B0H15DRAFT_796634 [Mycena belliarum]|uniref:DUF6532 domain-containing protein n=1 Tax=Mycena belliarum TaxID=1033014 RepID=A0AAD6XY65_9AGAR|nr:hypothetical protein B0H15DRAFT_796634 [Mycena belliae]